MRRLFFAIAALVACTPEPKAAKPTAPPTEEDACERFCGRLAACGIAPTKCGEGCERDRRKYRDGFFPSFVGCLERELPDHVCATKNVEERRQTLSLCFGATVEATPKDPAALKAIVAAVCARGARCSEQKEDVAVCREALEKRLAARVQSTIFGVARPELVASVAACVEKAPCAEDDPVATCVDRGVETSP